MARADSGHGMLEVLPVTRGWGCRPEAAKTLPMLSRGQVPGAEVGLGTRRLAIQRLHRCSLPDGWFKGRRSTSSTAAEASFALRGQIEVSQWAKGSGECRRRTAPRVRLLPRQPPLFEAPKPDPAPEAGGGPAGEMADPPRSPLPSSGRATDECLPAHRSYTEPGPENIS